MEAADFVKSHEYHAFLSYNTEDIEAVKVVKDILERAGLDVYFAPQHLRGALELHRELALKIENSACFVLFIGRHGMGPYQGFEVDHASSLRRPIVKAVLREGDPRVVGRWFNARTLDYNEPATEYELIENLIESITGMALLRVPLQFRLNEKMEVALPDRVLKLNVLSTINPEKRLTLNWVTLGHLIDYLRTQIKAFPGFRPSAYIGINATGLIVAQFLNEHREAIGYIQTKGGGGGRELDDEKSLFPKLAGGKRFNLLVVDGEIKTGSCMDVAIRLLGKRYPTAELYYAALAAMVAADSTGQPCNELLAGPCIRRHLKSGAIKRIFIGATFKDPGFFRPYEIR